MRMRGLSGFILLSLRRREAGGSELYGRRIKSAMERHLGIWQRNGEEIGGGELISSNFERDVAKKVQTILRSSFPSISHQS